MVKNINVVEDFTDYSDFEKKSKTKHLFIEDNVLYSYGYHYPLCIKINNSNNSNFVYFINSDGYSNTTSKHRGYLVRSITRDLNFKELIKAKNKGEYEHIYLMTTENLKKIIDTIKYDLNKSVKQSNINDIALIELEKNLK